MAIYTRTGDKGMTSLFSGKRVWKNHARVETYGTIDELNALLGVIHAHIGQLRSKKKVYLQKIVVDIQNTLFYIGSYLADLPDTIEGINLPQKTKEFEKKIDEMTEKLPQLSNFILPGGSIVGALFQQARTVARRAERQLIKLIQDEKIDDRVIAYINRLSDLLFTMSRFANHIEKKKEKIWSR